MARKTTTNGTTRKTTSAKTATAKTTTGKRGTPIPRNAQASSLAQEISDEMIARRAYEIYASGTGGSQEENWFRAERELRGQ